MLGGQGCIVQLRGEATDILQPLLSYFIVFLLIQGGQNSHPGAPGSDSGDEKQPKIDLFSFFFNEKNNEKL